MNYALNKHFDKLSDRLAKSQEPTALVQSSEFKVQGLKNLSKKHWFRKNKC
ncbi:MAG: hypothetical protein J6Q39_03330 [Bacteroidales bacterium]|nr:hypothetical protein [Bacteroidales bacterium]